MERGIWTLALVGVLLLAKPWSARAGDGNATPKTVEERLGAVEKRLDAIEAFLRPVQEQMGPSLLKARKSANEAAALATLRNVVSSEAQLQMSAKVDEDQDGNGEYGGFLEMSGGSTGRMGALLNPPVLSAAFRVLDGTGAASRSGYHFRIFLPGKDGSGLAEPQTGFAKGSGVDAERAEVCFCCYAWPVKQGESGDRTFVVNQAGDILATTWAAYSGEGAGPQADAAFKTAGRIDQELAAGRRAADGNVWTTLD